MSKKLRIAIDGPSGSGKSTLGRALAARLGVPYVDTGAMYRAIGWAAREAGASEPAELVTLLADVKLEISSDDEDGFRVFVDDRDITSRLRDPEVSKLAARVAAFAEVREWMVPRQRATADAGAVMEGRDIGTVVLPDADFKFYVTSAENTRMVRRAAQLGMESGGDEVVQDVRERDRMDRSRRHSPLRPAADAITIDTSEESVEESLARMLEFIGA